MGPGRLPAQLWCRPKGDGRSCASLVLDHSLIVVRSESLQLWAELPALAPGARCLGGRSVRSGAPEAGPEGSAVSGAVDGHQARNIRDPLRVLEQGPDRQRAPDVCSGGVSSICGASESRCSHDGSAGGVRQALRPIRHWSSPEAMGVHEGDFMAAVPLQRLRACVSCRVSARASSWPGCSPHRESHLQPWEGIQLGWSRRFIGSAASAAATGR
jgi:hypothetical protein